MASTRSSQSWVSGRSRRLTSFVGREPEIETVTGLLARRDVRLVTLTGPGGIGKTRLAEHVLERQQDAFPDGAAFVDLSPLRDAALILPAIAQAAGVPADPDQSVFARVQGFLAARRLLLALDNLEHLVDGAVPIVLDLLAGCPDLVILATSRIRLHISGERVIQLPPLDAGAARGLFLARATALDGEFVLTEAVSPAVDAICARLDGLPLAIELAAARTPVLPPPALLARLERSLPLLSGGPRDAPERQRGMRETIAWSYELLTEPQQALVRRLGVFVGGFTLDAATAVANGGEDGFADLSSLVAASLVRSIPGVGDEPRFTMLETIREFALELLQASGEGDAIGARHARYFKDLAEEALPHYDGPGLPLWNARIDRELDNCRAAMTWALAHDDGVTGTRLAGALWRVWWFRQPAGGQGWIERVTEGRAWIERVLEQWPELPFDDQAEALIGAGFHAQNLGDLDAALAIGEPLLSRALAEDHPYGIYWAHHLLGSLKRNQWNWYGSQDPVDASNGSNTAWKHFSESLNIAPRVRNPENHAAMSLDWLGSIAISEGRLEEARQLLDQAVGYCRISGNPYILAQCLIGLGRVERRLGDVRACAVSLQEAHTIALALLTASDLHVVTVEVAELAMATGHDLDAARLLGAADTLPAHSGYRGHFESTRDQARATLTAPRFDQAWQAGRAFKLEDQIAAVTGLLEDLARSKRSVGDPRPEPHGLTAREMDVLRLVADGQSNRQIGETLSISERTVENHVLHILAKLNLDSRTAAATWAVRNGLD